MDRHRPLGRGDAPKLRGGEQRVEVLDVAATAAGVAGLAMADDRIAWAIWDRAAMDTCGPEARPGDRALAAALGIHGIAMNGGLAHTIEFHTPEELAAGCAGFRYFGLDEAADAIEWLAGQVERDPDGSSDRIAELERDAERRYDEVIPTDAAFVDRFRVMLSSHPDQFAPLTP